MAVCCGEVVWWYLRRVGGTKYLSNSTKTTMAMCNWDQGCSGHFQHGCGHILSWHCRHPFTLASTSASNPGHHTMPHAFDLSLAGPFMGHMFLLVVDAHSKWRGSDGPIQSTIQKLRTIHGLLETIVSDNATCFRSAEFKVFLSRNGTQHILSASYDPATNGLAERAVQTFKESIKKATQGDIETKLSRLLFHYRITPHSTTGV